MIATTTVDGQRRLAGARCDACATHTFPAQASCPRCGATLTVVGLPAAGTVWSWTVQRIAPKPPFRGDDPFQPFALGYVDLGPIRVESRLEGKPIDAWTIGDAVQLELAEPDDSGAVAWYRFTDAADPEVQP